MLARLIAFRKASALGLTGSAEAEGASVMPAAITAAVMAVALARLIRVTCVTVVCLGHIDNTLVYRFGTVARGAWLRWVSSVPRHDREDQFDAREVRRRFLVRPT